MQERVLNILEYTKIRELLVACCVSMMGKQAAQDLLPSGDRAQVEVLLEQTQEADDALIHLGRSPVDAFTDVRMALKKSHVTIALCPKELLEIGRAMRASRLCKQSLQGDTITGHLKRMGNMLHACRAVEEQIAFCILSEEEIADNASPKLASVRRQIRAANDRVRDKLNSLLNNKTFKLYMQEPIITMRSGRYVLPVKQEYRSSVPGLLHDQSGSGATLFIEPMAVVEIGNQVKQLQAQEQEEIERILAALTVMSAEQANELIGSLDLLAAIDVIFAKAKLARQMKAVRPQINDRGIVRIIAGRHPLIDKEVVVPIDVWIGKTFHTLIVTGPNTGGKTVTLKTVGLFSLMAQSGLFVSAGDGVELCVFSDVFADIGDEQSIAQSLSTFSSHMKNIVHILNTAKRGDLVLLDELGAGTDPIEGAALAMSILEELHARGVSTLATTHYSELKVFALTQAGMENACMEFDLRTLRPTYRLFIGIPGKSNAFEISRKLGLSDAIIDQAQKHLNQEDVRFEDVISSAQSQRQIAEEEKLLATQAREELYKLREEVAQEHKKLEQQREGAMKKSAQQAKAVLKNAQAEAERIIEQLKNAKGTAVDREIQEARDALREQQRQFDAQNPGADGKDKKGEQKTYGDVPKIVKIGDTVFVTTVNAHATVLSLPDQKDEVQVQAGIMKLTCKRADLRTSTQSPRAIEKRAVVLAQKQVGLSVDLRGMTSDEAIMHVDQYLNDAGMASIHEVSIIHGKGTGALRSAVHDFLRAYPGVKAYRLGRYGEGETGVTVVELK